MPRCARIKDSNFTYHVICRSISELDLFRDSEDKQKYIELLKKYKAIFNFKVYAYCLMDNHLHLIIYSNGADISKIMHGINQSYSQYYNRKHSRHGHVFQDRFKSKVVDNDRYLFVLSLYVHNNPRSLTSLESVCKYEFSSLPLYLGLASDKDSLVDTAEILSRLCKDTIKARERYYYQFSTTPTYTDDTDYKMNDESFDAEIVNNIIEYRSEKVPLIFSIEKDDILDYLSNFLSIEKFNIHIKHVKGNIEYKAIAVFMMRGLCNMSIKEICHYLGDISQSYVSKLCSKGYQIANASYPNIISDFIILKKTA